MQEQTRPIEELLKISDYSTMTQDEIDSLIEYKTMIAAKDGYAQGLHYAMTQAMQTLANAYRDKSNEYLTRLQEVAAKSGVYNV